MNDTVWSSWILLGPIFNKYNQSILYLQDLGIKGFTVIKRNFYVMFSTNVPNFLSTIFETHEIAAPEQVKTKPEVDLQSTLFA